MKKKTALYLALDLGASSGRAVLGAIDGGRVSLCEFRRFPNGPVEMGGTLYWDFPRLWEETRGALRACATRGIKRLDGIGVDTWGVDFGLIGSDGRLNGNPFCYRDAITEGMVEIVNAAVPPAKLYKLTGLFAARVGTLPQLIGLRRAAGGRLPDARLLMMPDLFRYFLCGHVGIERSAAGSSLLTNIRTGRWCREILKAFDLPARLLPDIVPSGTVVGRLNDDLAKAAGLNRARVIAVAGHDTLSATAAAPYADDETVFLSAGTWSVAGMPRSTPITTPEAMKAGFVNELAAEGVLFAKNLIGLYLFENLKRALESRGECVTYTAMVRAAAAQRPFAHYLDVSAPEFFVTNDPMAAAGAYLKRAGGAPVRAWPALARAILEGLAWSYRRAALDLAAVAGCAFKRITLVGGGARNGLLCQMTADATGLEVLAGPAEATAAGNIGLQAMATGVVRGAEGVRALVRNSFEVIRYRPKNVTGWDKHASEK